MTKGENSTDAAWSQASVSESEARDYLTSQGALPETSGSLVQSTLELRGAISRGDLFLLAMAFKMGLAQGVTSDAKNTGASSEGIELPEAASELYDDRADRSENPIDFMNRVWAQWLAAGVLFQDQLRKLDPKLIPAIKSYCQRRKIDAKTVLPPPRHVRLAMSVGETVWMDQLVERQKSAAADLEKRYQRQK